MSFTLLAMILFLIINLIFLYIIYGVIKKNDNIPFTIGLEFRENLSASIEITNIISSFNEQIRQMATINIEKLKILENNIYNSLFAFYQYNAKNILTWEYLMDKYQLNNIQIETITNILQQQPEVKQLENIKITFLANVSNLLLKNLDKNKQEDLLLYGNFDRNNFHHLPVHLFINNIYYLLQLFIKSYNKN